MEIASDARTPTDLRVVWQDLGGVLGLAVRCWRWRYGVGVGGAVLGWAVRCWGGRWGVGVGGGVGGGVLGRKLARAVGRKSGQQGFEERNMESGKD
eukprot:354376-Chlamydomonas_euryale.AAC.4